MSDTPRTDEEVEIAKKFPATSHGLWVSAEFARQLERELSARPEVGEMVTVPRSLLEAAQCPNPGCEGQGWYVVANRRTGEPEQEQCQWCFERSSYMNWSSE